MSFLDVCFPIWFFLSEALHRCVWVWSPVREIFRNSPQMLNPKTKRVSSHECPMHESQWFSVLSLKVLENGKSVVSNENSTNLNFLHDFQAKEAFCSEQLWWTRSQKKLMLSIETCLLLMTTLITSKSCWSLHVQKIMLEEERALKPK